MEEKIRQLLEPPIWCNYPKELGCYLLYHKEYNKQSITESDCMGHDAYNKF